MIPIGHKSFSDTHCLAALAAKAEYFRLNAEYFEIAEFAALSLLRLCRDLGNTAVSMMDRRHGTLCVRELDVPLEGVEKGRERERSRISKVVTYCGGSLEEAAFKHTEYIEDSKSQYQRKVWNILLNVRRTLQALSPLCGTGFV